MEHAARRVETPRGDGRLVWHAWGGGRVIPNAGHRVAYEAPDAFNALLRTMADGGASMVGIHAHHTR